jgi:hypothetical protein
MYLDSSAIVKLVAQEAETRDLGIFLVAHREHRPSPEQESPSGGAEGREVRVRSSSG